MTSLRSLDGQIDVVQKEIEANTKAALTAVGRGDESKEKDAKAREGPAENDRCAVPANVTNTRKPICEALMKSADTKKERLVELARQLVEAEAVRASHTAAAPRVHPIADALVALRDQLLATNHDPPCIKPTQLKAEISFEVVKKVEGGVEVTLFEIVSLGTKAGYSNDRVQTLEVVFDLTDSSLMLQ